LADRTIYKTRKDENGDITALCGNDRNWSPREKNDAIADIESGEHTYYVPWRTGRTEIFVAEGPSGKYLRTDNDKSAKNNLNDLVDC
jgi:hypothetical protein